MSNFPSGLTNVSTIANLIVVDNEHLQCKGLDFHNHRVKFADDVYGNHPKLNYLINGTVVNTAMNGLFHNDSALTTFDMDCRNITACNYSFSACSALTTVNMHDMRNCQYSNYMFVGCPITSIKFTDNDIFTNLISCNSMFSGCNSLTEIKIGSFPNITEANRMFTYCDGIENVEIGDMPELTSATDMFDISCADDSGNSKTTLKIGNINKLSKFDLNNFSNFIGNITIGNMDSCTGVEISSIRTSALTIGNLPSLNSTIGTSVNKTDGRQRQITTDDCTLTSLTIGDINGFTGGNLFDTYGGLYKLKDLTIGDMENAETLNFGCFNMTQLSVINSGSHLTNITIGNTPKLTACTIIPNNVEYNYMKSFHAEDFSNVKDGSDMFRNMYQLSDIVVPHFKPTKADRMFFLSGTSVCGRTSLTTEDTGIDLSEVTSLTSCFCNNNKLSNIDLGLDRCNNIHNLDYAFQGCSSLTKVAVNGIQSSSLTSTFSGCFNLTDITLGLNNTSVLDKCFGDCTKLTSITLNAPILSAWNGALSGCTKLSSITINNNSGFTDLESCISGITNNGIRGFTGDFYSLKYIYPAYAFSSKTAMSSVSLTIHNADDFDGLFSGKTALRKAYIDFPDATTLNGTFSGCTSLSSITMTDMPNLKALQKTFYGCKLSSNTEFSLGRYENVTNIYQAFYSSKLSVDSLDIDYHFPNAVSLYRTFYGCDIKSVTGNGAYTNLQYAFANNTGMTNAEINFNGISGVSKSGPFGGCSSLTDLVINNYLMNNDGYSLGQMNSLSSVTFNKPNVSVNITNSFFNAISSTTNTSLTVTVNDPQNGNNNMMSGFLYTNSGKNMSINFNLNVNKGGGTTEVNIIKPSAMTLLNCSINLESNLNYLSITSANNIHISGNNIYISRIAFPYCTMEDFNTNFNIRSAVTAFCTTKQITSITINSDALINSSAICSGNSYVKNLSISADNCTDLNGAVYLCDNIESIDIHADKCSTFGNIYSVSSASTEDWMGHSVMYYKSTSKISALTSVSLYMNYLNSARGMFNNSNKLKSFNGSLNSLTDANSMFYSSSIEEYNCPLTSAITDTTMMFAYCNNTLKKCNIGDLSNISGICGQGMFTSDKALTTVYISNLPHSGYVSFTENMNNYYSNIDYKSYVYMSLNSDDDNDVSACGIIMNQLNYNTLSASTDIDKYLKLLLNKRNFIILYNNSTSSHYSAPESTTLPIITSVTDTLFEYKTDISLSVNSNILVMTDGIVRNTSSNRITINIAMCEDEQTYTIANKGLLANTSYTCVMDKVNHTVILTAI